MPTRALVTRLLLLVGAAFMSGSKCGSDDDGGGAFFTDAEWTQIKTLTDLPAAPVDTTNSLFTTRLNLLPAAQIIGKQYFFDPRFSGPLVHADNTIPVSGNGPVGTTGTISCARCHNPATGFSDQRTVPDETSLGAGFTGRNAPTLYNVEQNTWYFWDGRKDSLWSQALGPTESPVEHNGNRVQFAMVIRDHYRAAHEAIFGPLPAFIDDLDDLGVFNPAFPTPPAAPAFSSQGRPGDSGAGDYSAAFASYDVSLSGPQKAAIDKIFSDFGKAIQTYERRIVSTNSEFDKFVAGQPNTFGDAAQRGLKLFIGKGRCIVCHRGPNFTDNVFHNIAIRQQGVHVPVSPPADRGRIDGVPTVLADPFNGGGAFSDDTVAGNDKLASATTGPVDLGKIKTPTLRSIGETGPYMHTGSLKTLQAVMLFYDRGGDATGFVGTNELTPLGLSQAEIDDLIAFLLTLDGEELPANITSVPVLPP
ncbi:MAG TPA: cytochrome c peroxidase [Planctomycetota bacterium]